MLDFKAKMRQIRFRLGLSQTPLGELTQTLYLYLRGLLLKEGKKAERKEGGEEKQRERGGEREGTERDTPDFYLD